MEILWICNIPLPEISEELNIEKNNVGGWLTGLKNDLQNVENIKLNICFPFDGIDNIKKILKNNVNYYAIPRKINNPIKEDKEIQKYFEKIIGDLKPDIIHIWGTEFPHTLSAVNACENLETIEKCVISIQGLVSIYASHYQAGLSQKNIKTYTIRDFFKNDNIEKQIKKFKIRGKYEVTALKKIKYVIGRTDWDRACTEKINNKVKYFFCNETLRDEFYDRQWDYLKCEKNSLFISQGNYPIKGLHFALEALYEVKKEFPEIKLYIAGNNLTKSKTLKEKLKISSYGMYIKKLIKKLELDKYVIFLGNLNEKEMCERFLKSNIFISASSIENSPNSVGEAMILGVPVVSSDVGGVKNLLKHEEEGYLYQYDAPYMLSYYIKKILREKNVEIISKNAIKKAKITHDKTINLNQILKIYQKIIYKN